MGSWIELEALLEMKLIRIASAMKKKKKKKKKRKKEMDWEFWDALVTQTARNYSEEACPTMNRVLNQTMKHF